MASAKLIDEVLTIFGYVLNPSDANPCEDQFLEGLHRGSENGFDAGYQSGLTEGEEHADIIQSYENDLLKAEIERLTTGSSEIDPPQERAQPISENRLDYLITWPGLDGSGLD